MATPVITIGVTCYNAQNTIEAALASALNQNWPDKEIIVVDDASSDSSATLLESYPNIRLIRHKKNLGVAAARNKIIMAAKGDFIAFFDDDDISLPERLVRQYQRLAAYEEQDGRSPALCHCARTQIYPDGSRRYESTIGTDEGRPAPAGEPVARRILTGKPFRDGYGSLATCSQMARTSLYKSMGGFDENFLRSEDTDFALRHALKGGTFLGIADPLVIQTMTLGAEKTANGDLAGFHQLYRKHAGYLRTIDPNGFYTAWQQVKEYWLTGRTVSCFWALFKLFARHPFLTLQKTSWALPNAGFNLRYKKFQTGNV